MSSTHFISFNYWEASISIFPSKYCIIQYCCYLMLDYEFFSTDEVDQLLYMAKNLCTDIFAILD